MNILIVGGAGYLGSHVSRLLGNRCKVYDNLMYRHEFLDDVSFVYGDVNDHKHLSCYLKEAETVIWLAAVVGDAACELDPVLAMETNTEAVKFLAKEFDGLVIFTSTASVYGFSNFPVTETSPLNPLSIYAETKANAEGYLLNRQGPTTILRLGTLYGVSPRMRFDLVVNAMSRDAVMKKEVNVFGGDQWRSLAHVGGVAELIRSLVGGEHESGVYNITDVDSSIGDIATLVQGIAGGTVRVHGSGCEDARSYVIDGTKSLALRPAGSQVSMAETVAAIKRMLVEGRIRNPYGDQYINVKARL